ncbi:MAG TPA: UDP-N-acetylenolpyruvoylglucosamine reductase, partial [Candidatus Pacebacteria bacterium]|nr:UDP-N-acetylenolpyruvoylglucosamine reductase [Candidatus Paceibacterota bacterium]
MLNIQENISLKKYTTFEIGGEARYFVEVESLEDIEEAIVFARDKNIE